MTTLAGADLVTQILHEISNGTTAPSAEVRTAPHGEVVFSSSLAEIRLHRQGVVEVPVDGEGLDYGFGTYSDEDVGE